MKTRSNTKKSMKACKAKNLPPKAMKVRKGKTLLSLPMMAKVTKVDAVIGKAQVTKSSDMFRVVSFPHLGLGLKIGRCYTKAQLVQLCQGNKSKIKKLEKTMKDPSKLCAEDNAPAGTHVHIHIGPDNAPCEQIRTEKVTTKAKPTSGLQKAIGKAALKLMEKSKSNPSQKKAMKGRPKKAKTAVKTAKASKAKAVITISKSSASKQASMRSSATKVQCPSSGSKSKPQSDKTQACQGAKPLPKKDNQEEQAYVGYTKKKLMALTLPTLEKIYKKYKKNAVGTEPVNDTLAQSKEEFISKKQLELKKVCSKKELTVGGTKRVLVKRLIGKERESLKAKMVQAILIFDGRARSKARKQEAEERAEAQRQKQKVYNAATKLKQQVVAKTGVELKKDLKKYGLKTSGTKDEQVERVVAKQREEGEVERIVLKRDARARRQELQSMTPGALIAECKKAEDVLQDDVLKRVMLDRLLSKEAKKNAATPWRETFVKK